MRQITIDAIRAFRNHQKFKRDNTEVKIVPVDENYDWMGATLLVLHGYMIATRNINGLYITNAGYQTNVTKERLNGLPNVHIVQRDFQWFLNGEPWDGQYVKV